MFVSALWKMMCRLHSSGPRSRHLVRPRQTAAGYQPRLETLEMLIVPCTISWNNPLGGDWHLPGNWSPAALPGPNDEVCIALPGNYTVTHSQGTDRIRRLTSQGRLVLSGGSVELANASAASTVYNAFEITGSGSLRGVGNLTVHSTLTWTGGDGLFGPGAVTLAAGARLNVSGPYVKTLSGRTLNISAGALADWSGTGTILINPGTVLNNDGTFDVQTHGFWYSGLATFNNSGTFRRLASGSAVIDLGGLQFNNLNTGQVQVLYGALELSGGGASSGAFLLGSGTWLKVSGLSPYTLLDGTSSTGAGQLNVGVGGALWIAGVATVENLLLSGTLTGPAALTVTGRLDWGDGGTMSDTGQTLVTGELFIGGDGDKFLDGRALDNYGYALWTAGPNDIHMSYGAALNNYGLFEVRNSRSILRGPGAMSVFTNYGEFLKRGSAGTTALQVEFNDWNLSTVETGTLSLSGGTSAGWFYLDAPATLLFPAGAYTLVSIDGGGTVRVNGATVTMTNAHVSAQLFLLDSGILNASGSFYVNHFNANGGDLHVAGFQAAGCLDIHGNYTQVAATLHIEIGGLLPCTEHDQLNVSGLATLAGRLQIGLFNGFSPSIGDLFTFLTYGGRNGSFTTVAIPSLLVLLPPGANSWELRGV